MFHPICEHRPIWLHFVPSADGTKMFADGSSHLPTVPSADGTRRQIGQNIYVNSVSCEQRPIWLHFVQSADGTSADWTSRLPTFCLICRQFVQSTDGTKCLQMGHPICRQSRLQTGRVAILAGTYMRTASHLPTLCPIWWYFVQSADRTTVCRWDVLSTNGPVCRLDKMFVDGTFYLPTVPSADGTKCSQIYHPFCWQSRLQTKRVARLG